MPIRLMVFNLSRYLNSLRRILSFEVIPRAEIQHGSDSLGREVVGELRRRWCLAFATTWWVARTDVKRRLELVRIEESCNYGRKPARSPSLHPYMALTLTEGLAFRVKGGGYVNLRGHWSIWWIATSFPALVTVCSGIFATSKVCQDLVQFRIELGVLILLHGSHFLYRKLLFRQSSAGAR